MTIEQLFQDKSIKSKGKVTTIGSWLINGELPIDELIAYAEKQKATNKATCIESVEYATKTKPTIADESLLEFVVQALNDDEPKIKWESARVIGNVAKLFPTQLDNAVHQLLRNAEHTGTVVRWATAFALAEILKLKLEINKKLLPTIESLCEKEQDNGVKKKYLDALKKIKK